MGVQLLSQYEAEPSLYPVPVNLALDAPEAVPAAVVWQRVEAFISHRFTARVVQWVVDGEGAFCPPLIPATITTTELWQDDAWAPVTLRPDPLGGVLIEARGIYRITADVGAGPAPEAVNEAVRRLWEYMAARAGDMFAGSTMQNVSEGSLSISTRRAAAWQALAIHNSGAADLLRPYRRAPRA